MRAKTRIATLVSGCLVAIALSSCGGADEAPAEETKSLQALSILYGKYRAAHGGRIPASKEDFVSYVTKHETSLLNQFAIPDANELFVSPRGERPLVVLTGSKTLTGDNPIIAYESEITDGKRIVVRSYGGVEELEEAAFQRETSGK